MSADAQWCGQCYTPRAALAAAPVMAFAAPVGGAPARAIPVKTEAPAVVRTRWRKTPTTFGPLGRVSGTIGLVVMLAFFIVGGIITGGMTLVGAGIWGFVIMPWALRDLWRAGTLPAP
jgi:hypothetical protein